MANKDLPEPKSAQNLNQWTDLEIAEPSIPLSHEEEHPRSTVKEQIALREEKVRRRLSYSIAGMFGGLNVVTIAVICWLAQTDQHDLAGKIIPASGRVIDTDVIMSLLGATTVQLGTIAVIMARFVFRDQD